ncbi:MAG: hypothetical protein O2967_20360 [Proteobacteria bacterium]|nr:hypothetical protein [Pseudomonadota bacterium]
MHKRIFTASAAAAMICATVPALVHDREIGSSDGSRYTASTVMLVCGTVHSRVTHRNQLARQPCLRHRCVPPVGLLVRHDGFREGPRHRPRHHRHHGGG